MEELSIEQKAQRYDKALEKARQLCAYPTTKPFISDLQDLFPELKESEDERMSKYLIKYFEANKDELSKGFKWNGITVEECIAWLEKQGQTFTKKDVDDAYLKGISAAKHELEKQGEQKPANEVKLKFKVGDIIKPKDGGHEPWQIIQVDMLDKKYRYKDGYVIHFSQEDAYELVEQKAADMGKFTPLTVERAIKVSPFMRTGFEDEPADKVEPKFEIGDLITNGKLVGKIEAIHKRGYHAYFGDHYADVLDIENWHKWTIKDAKDSELQEVTYFIPKGFHAEIDDDKVVIKEGEKPTAWSEEDKDFMYDTLSNLTEMKDRYGEGYGNVGKCIDWLKSLKDRVGCEANCTTTWEPSDEQLDALQYVYRNCKPLLSDNLGWDSLRTLELMYQDLKKLKQ